MSREMLFASGIGFLCGGLFGTVLQQLAIQWMLFTDVNGLPWMVKTRLTRYFGWLKWSKACSQVEIRDRALYATILIGTLHDLGGPLLLAPKSKAAFDGMLAEAERRYSEALRERKRR
jgi:hypothetical protein